MNKTSKIITTALALTGTSIGELLPEPAEKQKPSQPVQVDCITAAEMKRKRKAEKWRLQHEEMSKRMENNSKWREEWKKERAEDADKDAKKE